MGDPDYLFFTDEISKGPAFLPPTRLSYTNKLNARGRSFSF